MARMIKIEPNRTYATRENAVKAVEKALGGAADGLIYFLHQSDDGRFFPVFVGRNALDRGVHFKFHVVG